MSKKRTPSTPGTMLEMWRPPRDAGDALGCLATTYTFTPSLFDEQCLARFLSVDSDPDREDLAYLLEREARLGGAYAGVLVDHTQAGIEHSLRWDVLPVRIWAAKQHAKLSLLAWTRHVRVVVTSANLTEAGYRYNREIAFAIDSTPESASQDQVAAATDFLRCLLAFVPGAGPKSPEVKRASGFIDHVGDLVSTWKAAPTPRLRQQLVFTLPGRASNPATVGEGFDARSTLDEAIAFCRRGSGSPTEAFVASPFFDTPTDGTDIATASLCKAMARGIERRLTICVPEVGKTGGAWRLAAPASLQSTPCRYKAVAEFRLLPRQGEENEERPWHAKMLALRSDAYSALVVGSSNFTQAGLGIGRRHNAEANVLVLAERQPHAREPAELEAVWPDMEVVKQAEWQGPRPELEEEELAENPPLPGGFLTATYHAGPERRIVLRLDPEHIPQSWTVLACGTDAAPLLNSDGWRDGGGQAEASVSWPHSQPPTTLRVQWDGQAAVWPLNVDDARQLPPPIDVGAMTADEMLAILAAADPSAAYRGWAKRQSGDGVFDAELDAAIPDDLDPLRRYDLRATFLRRVRSRARMLADLRERLEGPAFSEQALRWRLDGFIGVRALAGRLAGELAASNCKFDEALLTLADFLIVLREVDYCPAEGAVAREDFERIYQPFLTDLVVELDRQVEGQRAQLSSDLSEFWNRVVTRCRQ